MQTQEEKETFYPKTRKQWRQWLQRHHDKKQSIWLVQYKKESGVSTISWSEAVDEALCFGWIDSTRRPLDGDRFIQYFTRRKPKSVWSKINKDKIERLTGEGLMTPAGQQSVDIAKQNGSWTRMDTVEALEIPADLAKKFKTRPGAKAFFMSLSKSVQKVWLYRLAQAKREETRKKRLDEIVTFSANKQKPLN